MSLPAVIVGGKVITGKAVQPCGETYTASINYLRRRSVFFRHHKFRVFVTREKSNEVTLCHLGKALL